MGTPIPSPFIAEESFNKFLCIELAESVMMIPKKKTKDYFRKTLQEGDSLNGQTKV